MVGWPARGPRRAAGAALLLIAALCVAAAPPTAAVLHTPVVNAFYKAGERAHTDKVTSHSYHHTYELLLRPLRHKRMKVLEIGLGCTMNTGSASINLWQDYFHLLDLWMADIDTACAAKIQNTTKNTILIGDQGSEEDLLRFIKEAGADDGANGFNLIVDDGSHRNAHQLESFRVLFEHGLAPGGIYVIEDIESPDTPLCTDLQPKQRTRDQVLYWMHQLMRFPRNLEDLDLPKGLQGITCQREACFFHKCPVDAVRCP